MEEPDVANFSLQARKGSSSNASPLTSTPRIQKRATVAERESRILRQERELSPYPTPALSRELKRLQSHNKPGLMEEKSQIGKTRSRSEQEEEKESEDFQ